MLFQRISLGALCGALLCIASALSSEPSRSAPGLTETELKAVFLLRLPQFVTWPEEGLGRTFCVDEGSEIASLLSDMISADPKGREVLSLARLPFAEGWSAEAAYSQPIYLDLHGPQSSEKFHFNLEIGTSF